MKYKYHIGLLFTVLLTSCYPDISRKTEEISLHHQVILGENELLLNKVKDISWVNDSVLVILDTNNERLFHVVDVRHRTVWGEYGKSGQGPDEFLFLSSLHSDKDGNLVLYDANRRESFIGEGYDGGKGMSFLSLFKSDSLFHIELLPVNGGFVASGRYDAHRFYFLDKYGRVFYPFGEYPYRDEEERKVSGFVRSEIYQGRLASDKSGNRFVQATLRAKILSFYKLNKNGNWECVTENKDCFPDYKYDLPALPLSSPVGYLDVCADDRQVYALYSGRNYEEAFDRAFCGSVVEVYDWKGVLLKKYLLDIDVQAIDLSRDGNGLYAIAYTPDPALVMFCF